MRWNDRKGVALIDFGISSVMENGNTMIVTRTGMTPEYSAPETFRGLFLDESDYCKYISITIFCLIAGRNKNGKPTLINCGCFKMTLNFAEVPMALYPPTKESLQDCNISFARNYKLHHDTFAERTIEDISKISSLVSSTGSKWTYNFEKQTGQFESF